MNKKELLSPAGDFESLKAAIHNGADAVYLAGREYGARKYAKNFSLDELEKAIKYAHLYEVKIYVTINTLIDEDDIDNFLSYVESLHKMNVDAVIMQDVGMIDLVHKTFPALEIHASTQVHNHNKETIEYLKSLGVKRIVFARELSLDEINKIDINIEKEAFIHGALCISYSGECLASSIILGRSGNKGECAGICRLPFELYGDNKKIETNGKYLLSAKELNTTSYLKDILDSDIYSLKIEGRMKSPEYVGFVTKLYRILIDKYYNSEELSISDEEYKNLKLLYNRKFTKGFINNEKSSDIVNIETPNHQGITLGKVLDIKNKIKILLEEDLDQNDGVRFSNGEGMIANFIYNEKGLLINHADKGNIVYLDNKVGLKEKGIVLKTSSIKLNESLSKYTLKKIPIDLFVRAKVGSHLVIGAIYNNINIGVSGIVVDSSINKPTTKEDIYSKLNKLEETPYKINKIEYDIDDNIFIPLKEINNLRRMLISKLEEEILKDKDIVINKISYNKHDIKNTNRFSFLVRNEEQLKLLINKDVDIYTEDLSLYKKYKSNNIFYRTPRVNNNFISFNNENVVSSELGSIYKYINSNNVIIDIYNNVTNSYTLNLYNKALRVGFSPELDINDIKKINNSYKEKYGTYPNVEVLIYGKIELMIMKYSLINKFNNGSSSYKLKDRNNKFYDIKEKDNINTLYNYQKINNLDIINDYIDIGVTNFRIDLLDESVTEIKKILKTIKKYKKD